MNEPPRRGTPPDEERVLPDTTQDEQERGWGDDRDGEHGSRRDLDWYERERPPHHE